MNHLGEEEEIHEEIPDEDSTFESESEEDSSLDGSVCSDTASEATLPSDVIPVMGKEAEKLNQEVIGRIEVCNMR